MPEIPVVVLDANARWSCFGSGLRFEPSGELVARGPGAFDVLRQRRLLGREPGRKCLEIRALLPHEPLLYLADSKYAPYGEKPERFVEARTLQACEWMIGQGCKALVIACNTATGHAVALLRERLPVPIIGVEPGLKPAAAASISKVVGVLATANTLKSAKFARLLASLAALDDEPFETGLQVLEESGFVHMRDDSAEAR